MCVCPTLEVGNKGPIKSKSHYLNGSLITIGRRGNVASCGFPVNNLHFSHLATQEYASLNIPGQ